MSEYIRHGQWAAYDKKYDDGLRQKQSTTRRFWSNRAFRNCRGVLETVCEVLSGPHRSLADRLPPPPLRISLRLAARLLRLPLKGGVICGANAILALGCVILSNRFDDFRERRAMPR